MPRVRLPENHALQLLRANYARFDVPLSVGVGTTFLLYGVLIDNPMFKDFDATQTSLPCEYQLSRFVLSVGGLVLFTCFITAMQYVRNLLGTHRDPLGNITYVSRRIWMDHVNMILSAVGRFAVITLLTTICVLFLSHTYGYDACQPPNNYGNINFLITIGFLQATLSFIVHSCTAFYGMNNVDDKIRKSVASRAESSDKNERRRFLENRNFPA